MVFSSISLKIESNAIWFDIGLGKVERKTSQFQLVPVKIHANFVIHWFFWIYDWIEKFSLNFFKSRKLQTVSEGKWKMTHSIQVDANWLHNMVGQFVGNETGINPGSSKFGFMESFYAKSQEFWGRSGMEHFKWVKTEKIENGKMMPKMSGIISHFLWSPINCESISKLVVVIKCNFTNAIHTLLWA